jgi:hypothetical protein
MTQVQFAAALQVAPTSIHRWEAGTGAPEFEMVVSLWSLAIERGSPTSKDFSDFLVSRTDAIRPLFEAKDLPDITALDREIVALPVEQRQLALAFIQMLKHNSDEITDRIMRVILEPWRQKAQGHPEPAVSERKPKRSESKR